MIMKERKDFWEPETGEDHSNTVPCAYAITSLLRNSQSCRCLHKTGTKSSQSTFQHVRGDSKTLTPNWWHLGEGVQFPLKVLSQIGQTVSWRYTIPICKYDCSANKIGQLNWMKMIKYWKMERLGTWRLYLEGVRGWKAVGGYVETLYAYMKFSNN